MEQYRVMKLPAYRAIGLKWEGPWAEIAGLKKLIQNVSERVGELPHAVDPTIQLGLSYHTRPDGFTHYSVYEVTEEQEIPEGMIDIRIPELTYLMTEHQKGKNIGETYHNIATYLKENNYLPYQDENGTYFDTLPIKHERYTKDRDQEDPHFEILIPIVK